MKKYLLFVFIAVMPFLVSCEKEGPAGKDGIDGIDGNANVKVYNFTNKAFARLPNREVYATILEIPELTKHVLENSSIVVYWVLDDGSLTDLNIANMFAGYVVGGVQIISPSELTGFYNFRVVIIPANSNFRL